MGAVVQTVPLKSNTGRVHWLPLNQVLSTP
jgi:hypothetical protein